MKYNKSSSPQSMIFSHIETIHAHTRKRFFFFFLRQQKYIFTRSKYFIFTIRTDIIQCILLVIRIISKIFRSHYFLEIVRLEINCWLRRSPLPLICVTFRFHYNSKIPNVFKVETVTSERANRRNRN